MVDVQQLRILLARIRGIERAAADARDAFPSTSVAWHFNEGKVVTCQAIAYYVQRLIAGATI